MLVMQNVLPLILAKVFSVLVMGFAFDIPQAVDRHIWKLHSSLNPSQLQISFFIWSYGYLRKYFWSTSLLWVYSGNPATELTTAGLGCKSRSRWSVSLPYAVLLIKKDTFHWKEPSFHIGTALETARSSVRPNSSVTGNDYREGIAGKSISHCAAAARAVN